jgi:hypothetical protein
LIVQPRATLISHPNLIRRLPYKPKGPAKNPGAAIMFFADPFTLLASLIEFIGAMLIIGYMLAALVMLVRTRNVTATRLLVADGAIAGLSFKLAGTLVKTIELHTWQQILMFVIIFALRIILKRLFTWERTRLQK